MSLNVISEVIKGYWRSKEVKIGNFSLGAISCEHTHMITPNIIYYIILSSEVNRCHWRSKRGQHLKIHPGMQVFAYISIFYP